MESNNLNEHILQNSDEIYSCIHSSNFSILHFNVRSLNCHFNELSTTIQTFKNKPSIIVCTETWKLKLPNLYNLDGYRMHYSEGDLTDADGVVVYMRNDLLWKVNTINLGQLRSEFIEVWNTETDVSKPQIVISAIYKINHINKKTFTVDLFEHVLGCRKYDSHIVIGDLNINLFEDDSTTLDYKYNFIQLGYISCKKICN